MFLIGKTLTTIYAELDESISRATLRPQDLIPRFLSVLKDTPEYAQTISVVPTHVMEDDMADWWESEDCIYFLNEQLFDILNKYAPDGYYFGSHIGDGSDFGYWRTEDELY